MGGGDLNLKKDWHPLTFKNQEAVWKREQEVEAEAKKLALLKKELEAERSLAELRALNESHGRHVDKTERLDWMYSMGPTPNQISSIDKEAYLLGTKRIDNLLKEEIAVDTFEKTQTNFYGYGANTYRDVQSKIREDPLLAIKRKEHDAVQQIIKRIPIVKQKKEKKKRKHDSTERVAKNPDKPIDEDELLVEKSMYQKRHGSPDRKRRFDYEKSNGRNDVDRLEQMKKNAQDLEQERKRARQEIPEQANTGSFNPSRDVYMNGGNVADRVSRNKAYNERD